MTWYNVIGRNLLTHSGDMLFTQQNAADEEIAVLR